MKERLTQVLILSVSLMLLSVVLPVNSSSLSQPQLAFTRVTDGVPLPPPHFTNTSTDGVPLPPPHFANTSTDGVPLPPPHFRQS